MHDDFALLFHLSGRHLLHRLARPRLLCPHPVTPLFRAPFRLFSFAQPFVLFRIPIHITTRLRPVDRRFSHLFDRAFQGREVFHEILCGSPVG